MLSSNDPKINWDLSCYAMQLERSSEVMCTASYLWRPKLYRDGDKWCALYGDNVQEGCCGFGDNPKEAMRDFDKNWGGNYD